VNHEASPKMSVIISMYNRGPYLRATLDSLVLQRIDPFDFGVVVTDDGSTDDSR
jgi:poly(ribitol-phosphate) beta-N-acetylglucosaminyltransferase